MIDPNIDDKQVYEVKHDFRIRITTEMIPENLKDLIRQVEVAGLDWEDKLDKMEGVSVLSFDLCDIRELRQEER